MNRQTRAAILSDAPAVSHVLRRSITECCSQDHRDEPGLIEAWLRNKTPANITAWIDNPRYFCVVALQAEAVVGFGMAEHDQILLCYAAPEVIGQGIGHALLSSMQTHAIGQGIVRLQLESTGTALRFYERQGFQKSGTCISAFGIRAQPMSKRIAA